MALGKHSRSLSLAPSRWRGWEVALSCLPRQEQTEAVRAKLCRACGMTNLTGKGCGCQGPQQERRMWQGCEAQDHSLVWDSEAKSHWHFYSGTCLFPVLYVLEKEKWYKNYLTSEMTFKSLLPSWPVWWNPRILIKVISLTGVHEIHLPIWKFCQNKLFLVCQVWAFPCSEKIHRCAEKQRILNGGVVSRGECYSDIFQM